MRSPPDPDAQLDVRLAAICGRNQYTRDPASVLAEFTAAAGARRDLLARTAGIWVGYVDSPETHVLADALCSIPGAKAWITEGQRRRRTPRHGAPTGPR